jgi:hypothetical protein
MRSPTLAPSTRPSGARVPALGLVLGLLAGAPAGAQALTPEVLAGLEAACPQDAPFRAMQNALAQTDVRRLALDWQRARDPMMRALGSE